MPINLLKISFADIVLNMGAWMLPVWYTDIKCHFHQVCTAYMWEDFLCLLASVGKIV